MARWKLMVSHYLNVPGEEWEYTENDRKTGRPRRTKFKVPRLLDINDPTCWTNKWGTRDNEEGEIIVCHEGKGDSSDVVFFGSPTPDMVPVDEEAKAISASFAHLWQVPVENTAGDYSQSLIDKFQVEMGEIQSRPVEVPGLSDLTSAIGEMAKQNQKLLETFLRRV